MVFYKAFKQNFCLDMLNKLIPIPKIICSTPKNQKPKEHKVRVKLVEITSSPDENALK